MGPSLPGTLPDMRERPRLRRAAKWIGSSICIAILVAFGLSLGYGVSWSSKSVPIQTSVQVYGGRALLHVFDRSKLRPQDLHGPTGWTFGSHWKDPIQLQWLRPGIATGAAGGLIRLGVNVPFWLPLLIVALPTAYLWHRDRRIPPGHCPHCGYDLTGNVSGVCPECGAEALASRAED